MTCITSTSKILRISALKNMGTTLSSSPLLTPSRLTSLLTPRELEVCVLHFVDDRPQTLIAEWLGTSLRNIQLLIQSATQKIPQLEPLRIKALEKPKRPRTIHLSQIPNPRDRSKGPFNADEI